MDHKYVYTFTHIKKIIVIDFEFFFTFNNARILTKRKLFTFFIYSNFIIKCNRKMQAFHLILFFSGRLHMFIFLFCIKRRSCLYDRGYEDNTKKIKNNNNVKNNDKMKFKKIASHFLFMYPDLIFL